MMLGGSRPRAARAVPFWSIIERTGRVVLGKRGLLVAPTGRDRTAQGKALGLMAPGPALRPERAKQDRAALRGRGCPAHSGRGMGGLVLPRALPWAVLSCPFRAKRGLTVILVAPESSVGTLTRIVASDRPSRYNDRVGWDECPGTSTGAHTLACFLAGSRGWSGSGGWARNESQTVKGRSGLRRWDARWVVSGIASSGGCEGSSRAQAFQ